MRVLTIGLAIALATALGLAGCGDLPQPFAGRPGLNAMRLAVPPPPRLVVPPPAAALLPARDAASWAHAVTDALVAEEIPAFAEPAHRGDWQLALTATMQGEVVAPHYTVLDPKGGSRGDVAGAPIAASLWAKGDPAAFAQAAAAAAPEILSLLRSVDASLKQSDPNSLYNRPARIYFAGVTGAPGDGNLSLARDMRTRLPDTGDQVVGTAAHADFTLKGNVRVSDLPSGQQQVEIHWIVSGPQGQLAGDVAQGKDIPKGSLGGYWGDVAVAITDEAADGVREVITNWSGRQGKAKQGRSSATTGLTGSGSFTALPYLSPRAMSLGTRRRFRMGGLSIWHWMVVLLVVLLLFGTGKVSTLMGDFAKGIKSFKKNMADEGDVSMEASAERPAGTIAAPNAPTAAQREATTVNH